MIAYQHRARGGYFVDAFTGPDLKKKVILTEIPHIHHPIHNTMPQDNQSTISTSVYHSAGAFLADTESHLHSQDMACNTILPLAQRYRARGGSRITPSSDNIWLASWTSRPSKRIVLDFVLAVVRSPIGKTLPVFIHSTRPTSSIDTATIYDHVKHMVDTLAAVVPRRRVFAVFAPTPITYAFTQCWSAHTGAMPINIPFYAAALTYVTRDTLTSSEATIRRLQSKGRRQLPYILQLATLNDLDDVATLCKAFADDAETYPISIADARREARAYIDAGEMYGCYVEAEDGTQKLISIAAVARYSGRNATITKVHTDRDFQRCSYAEVLVRFVCETLLYGPQHSYDVVSLFAAFENKPANITYDRVGFVGLMGKLRPDDVDAYLEIGFEDADMGFW